MVLAVPLKISQEKHFINIHTLNFPLEFEYLFLVLEESRLTYLVLQTRCRFEAKSSAFFADYFLARMFFFLTGRLFQELTLLSTKISAVCKAPRLHFNKLVLNNYQADDLPSSSSQHPQR